MSNNYHLQKWRETGKEVYAQNAVRRMEPDDLASLTEAEARVLSTQASLRPIEVLAWAEAGRAPAAYAVDGRRIHDCATAIANDNYPLHFNAALCEKIRAAAIIVSQEPVPQGSGFW